MGTLTLRRRQLGLSREQLAEKAGVKQSAIARLEKGNAVPRLDAVLRTADALDLRLELVPKEVGPRPPVESRHPLAMWPIPRSAPPNAGAEIFREPGAPVSRDPTSLRECPQPLPG
ncbi:MAG: helix-turn-helix domain-containing protein [Alicyclobacillus sp.]|nr:helix-turn-helix domain-containing protein [Alicyclobacillus sp.]